VAEVHVHYFWSPPQVYQYLLLMLPALSQANPSPICYLFQLRGLRRVPPQCTYGELYLGTDHLWLCHWSHRFAGRLSPFSFLAGVQRFMHRAAGDEHAAAWYYAPAAMTLVAGSYLAR
jgi:hypothetical protein